MEQLIGLLVPLCVTLLMFVAKWLTGFNLVGNGAQSHAALRLLLIVFSLFGTVAQSGLTGIPLDAASVTGAVTVLVTIAVNYLISHSFYKAILAWL